MGQVFRIDGGISIQCRGGKNIVHILIPDHQAVNGFQIGHSICSGNGQSRIQVIGIIAISKGGTVDNNVSGIGCAEITIQSSEGSINIAENVDCVVVTLLNFFSSFVRTAVHIEIDGSNMLGKIRGIQIIGIHIAVDCNRGFRTEVERTCSAADTTSVPGNRELLSGSRSIDPVRCPVNNTFIQDHFRTCICTHGKSGTKTADFSAVDHHGSSIQSYTSGAGTGAGIGKTAVVTKELQIPRGMEDDPVFIIDRKVPVNRKIRVTVCRDHGSFARFCKGNRTIQSEILIISQSNTVFVFNCQATPVTANGVRAGSTQSQFGIHDTTIPHNGRSIVQGNFSDGNRAVRNQRKCTVVRNRDSTIPLNGSSSVQSNSTIPHNESSIVQDNSI